MSDTSILDAVWDDNLTRFQDLKVRSSDLDEDLGESEDDEYEYELTDDGEPVVYLEDMDDDELDSFGETADRNLRF